MWSWGSDVYGRLGHGTEDKHTYIPTEIAKLAGVPLISAVCGSAHNVVVDTNGSVYTWGKCHYGQLGHGEMDQDEHIPRLVKGLGGVAIESVGVGDSHVLAVTKDGNCYSWGVGFYGCLGHGDEQSLAAPRLIEKLAGESVRSTSGGAFHSIALTREGKVFVWGRDHCGQLGMADSSNCGRATKAVRLNKKEPTELHLPLAGKMISACNDHTLVLLADGHVMSFGDNTNGQLGRASSDNVPSTIDQVHFKSEPVSFISTGWTHCTALTQSGGLYTWGNGSHGQLGLGHSLGTKIPKRVTNFPTSVASEAVIVSVSCGDCFTVCVTSRDCVMAFGSSEYGKLGRGSGGQCVLTPIIVSSAPTTLSGVCCGTNHTLAYQLVCSQ